MFVRALSIVVACGAMASIASAAVTEGVIIRQVAARARSGGNTSGDVYNNTNNTIGPFSDSHMVSAPGAGASTETVTHNTNISNGLYTGTMHADGTAAGNSTGGGDSDSSSAYSTFKCYFHVEFMVDVATQGHFFGTAAATRAATGSSGLTQVFLFDLDGSATQLVSASASASTPSVSTPFDATINLIAGHRYVFEGTTMASTNRQFATGPGTASSDLTFTAQIPSPGGAGVLAMAGLGAMRRRRR